MRKYIAELFGTFVLVFIGCGTAVFSAPYVGNVGISLAFGLALMAMVYAIGPVSGSHVNPAVTLGVWSAGRMGFKDVLGYIIFQFIGATLGAAVILYIANGHITGYDVAVSGLGQNGWGADYNSGYDIVSAAVFEFIATFIFIKVILKTTEGDLKIAGVVIGLTLAVIHILGIQITGVSVNPSRSFGPALFAGCKAMSQLWLFLLVPSVAGIFAGLSSRCCCCCSCAKENKTEQKKEYTVQKETVEGEKTSSPRRRTTNYRSGRRSSQPRTQTKR